MRQEAVYEELEYLNKIKYGLKANSDIYIKKNEDNDILNYMKDSNNVGVLDVDLTSTLLKNNNNFLSLNELNQYKSQGKKNEEINYVIFKCCIIENIWLVIKLSDKGYTIIDTFAEKPNFDNINDIDFNFLQNREEENNIYKYLNFTFETMENLLHTVSPGFRMQFKDSLINKLQLELKNINQDID